jgi:DNA-binding HxlR family transcriptional regulator
MDQNVNFKEQEVSLRWHCVQHKNFRNCKDECYFQTILTLFGKKHTLSIIRLLLIHDKLRFNEILNNIGASPKTITERLKDLKNHGLIKREVFNEIPIRVEYSLTKYGKSLEDIFERISIWVKNLMIEINAQK